MLLPSPVLHVKRNSMAFHFENTFSAIFHPELSFAESACETNGEVCNGFREVCVDGSIAGSYRCVCEAGFEYINSVCTGKSNKSHG